jgi:arylsulfatase A-like enzyme
VSDSSRAPERRGPFWPVLLPWLAVGVVDVTIVRTAYVQPAAWQFALEIVLLVGLGWAQWTFARTWLRSSLLAAIVAIFFGALPHTPDGIVTTIPFLAGVALPCVLLLRGSASVWQVPAIVGALVAGVVVLGVHWMDRKSQSSVTTGGSSEQYAAVPLAGRSVTSDAPPIIVLSIDTLRADSAESMQSVRRLAALGTYWPRAMSTSSWTLPALASLQTGVMPAEHGAACLEDSHCQGMSGSKRTIAEELRAAGWTTAAVVANPWAGTGMGFDRGFEQFVDPGQPGKRLLIGGAPTGPHGQDDARTIDEAIAWLKEAPDRGFYLWVHLMGPHMPYAHSPSEKMRRLDPVTLRSSYPSSAAQKKEIRDAYDAEVRYTDLHVMRLLDAIEARGILDHGTLVVTADHGEEFWEHGGVEHGHSHEGEVTDVPILLVTPGAQVGRQPGIASLIDVAPTLRSIAQLTASTGIDLRKGVSPDRIATAWGGIILRHDCSARDATRRLIAQDCSRELGAMRFYDTGRDPSELQPLRPSEDMALVSAVRAIEPPAKSEALPLGSDRLRALGYLQ